MKEEGEITDDDDAKQVPEIAEPAVAEKQVRCRAYKCTRKRNGDRRRRSINAQNDVQRSSDSREIRDRISVKARNTTTLPLEKLPVSTVEKTNPDLKVRPDTLTSTPPVTSTSSFAHLMSPPLLPLPQSQLRFKMTWKRFSNQSHHTSRSQNVTDGKDTEIVISSDSDMDVSDDDVIMIEMKPDDEDLDELLLYHAALKSAFESEKSRKKTCNSFSEDITLLSSECQHSGDIDLSSIDKVQNLLDINHHDTSLQGSVEKSWCVSDAVGVSRVVIPTESSADHIASNRPHLSEDFTLSKLNQQSNATSSSSLSNANLNALLLTDSNSVNSVAESDPALPVSQAVQQADIDNFEEVEMDLDSGSDSENAVVSSSEKLLEWTTNTTDQNFSQNQYTCTLVSLALSATTSTTDSVRPLMSLYCSSDNVVSRSSIVYPVTDCSNNVAESQSSKRAVVCTGHDDKIPALMDIKTEIVDSGIPSNVQQQRKVTNADKKELLLRAAVLQSLSSKRQQQSQLDTALYVPRDMKATKLQVMTHSVKRTVTSTASNELTVQLPVHQRVVIPLTGESSESDNEEWLEIPDSCDHSTTPALDSSAAMINNLDRFLHEMRKAADDPKFQDCDTAHFQQAVSTGKLAEHSTSESALANQYTLSPSSIMRSHGVTYSKGTSSVQKSALCDLERKILHEKRKLQQQKIALSKTKLKMARKKEHISAAEKRIKKLQEQLVAAQKITASSKAQLNSIHEERMNLCSEIEQCQKTIKRLEMELHLHMSQTNLENRSDLENLLSSEISSANPQSQLSDTAVHCNWGVSAEDAARSCHVHRDAVSSQKDSVTFRTTRNVSKPSLFTSFESLHNASSFVMSDTANLLHQPEKLRNLSTVGGCESESGMALVRDKFVKRELVSEVNYGEVGGSETLEQIASHSVNSPFPDVSGQPTVMQGSRLDARSLTKPISVSKPDKPTLQKSFGTSVSNFTAVSDKIGSGHTCSAYLDELTMPSYKKIKQIMHLYRSSLDRDSFTSLSASSCPLFVSDPVFCFQFPVNAASSVTASFLAAGAKSGALEIGDTYRPYHSSLLCFRSYRFSDSYHQREGLSVLSGTFSHKLDCRVPLCQFDLMGRCLDDHCPWQHQSDYSLSEREHLVDIVSYCPSVTGIDNSMDISMYENLMNQYVDTFLKDTFAQLSHSEQCLRLIDHVKTASGCTYPHATFTSARCWKLHGTKQHSTATDRNDLFFSSDDVPGMCMHESAADDIRYWMVAESDQIKNLEEAVTDTPTDDSLWIKLAYAKMMEMKWCESHDDCISYGLSVLTRAVEANPSNSRLWTHYLDLYMQRSDAGSDVSSLYEQAIQYAPSYEFFWKYLQLPASYSQKMSICKRLRQYLCSPMCCDEADTRSHHLLEIVLYQAALCTMSGRFKEGLQVIQAIVQSKASVIWLTLTPCDRIAMWLSFIHLYECRHLPTVLFDPADSNPGPVVRKEPFVVPFRMGTKTRISYKTLLQLFQSAFNACDKITAGSESSDKCSPWLAALHRSRILLELSCCGLLAGRHLCEELLQQRPHLTDVWLCLVQLTVAASSSTAEDHTDSSTIEKAVASNPHSVPLYLAGVSALIECDESDAALTFAERCPINLYEVEQLDDTSVDPNLLFCCLLGQPVPPNYKAPVLHSSVSRQYVADQQANLWLIYCILLDLQGAHDQATETYHLALSCLTKTNDIQRLWLAFLRRTTAVICQQLPWLSPATSYDQKKKLWQQFESDTHQALASIPVRRSMPHSSQTWDDYSCHNQIIELYVSCLSDVDTVQQVYDKYVRQMPGNVELQLTAVKYLLDQDMPQLCHGACLVALHSCPKAALLWNICLRLSECEGTANVGLLRALYAKATMMLPFSASLWKIYIMFEVINRSREHVKEALDKCQHMQVNVSGFVDSLLK